MTERERSEQEAKNYGMKKQQRNNPTKYLKLWKNLREIVILDDGGQQTNDQISIQN